MMKWTTDQQKVIDLRNRNILVSAAAGSGKTAVLVERIIAKISEGENPIDIDRLVIVTFTNAAAAEMRERIGKAIEKKIEEDSDCIHLQKQMTLLHHAQITTIHSFCLNIIRNYFHTIDMDPNFRLGDDAQMKLLKADVMSELLEESYENATEEFLDLVESFATGKSDSKLETMVQSLYGFSMSYPWPKDWLLQCKKDFDMQSLEEMDESKWMDKLYQYIKQVLGDLEIKIQGAIELCDSPGGPYPYLDALEEDRSILERLVRVDSYQKYYEAWGTIAWKRLSSKKDESIAEDLKEIVKQYRNEVKKAIQDMGKTFFFQPPYEMLEDIKNVKGVIHSLVDLTMSFSQKFAEAKEEKNLVDFNDLEHMALKILIRKKEDTGEWEPSAIADELSEYYDEILIDEYQDSNLVQETILSSVSKVRMGKPNLFMVGDVKQSIYKFRLAKPELFMEKFDSYDTEDSLYQRIDLHKNFRSRAVVLEGANYLFDQIMKKELGNIEYNDKVALYTGNSFAETELAVSDSMEVLFVGEEELEELEENIVLLEEEVEYSKRELEALAIASRIHELTDAGEGMFVFDKGHHRKTEFGDIVILLRAMSGWADVFAEVLMSQGIPAYSDTQTGYFSALEVQTVLNMLRIIDNPRQDIPLTAVLRSPLVGFTDEELAWIRIPAKGMDIYDALVQYQSQDNPLQQKVNEFLSFLNRYREMVPYSKVYEVIQRLLDETKYYYRVMAMPGGERRSANLAMLLQKAVDYDSASFKGLFRFVRYMEKLDKYDIDFGEASVGGENENAVRIMSIHKSKGLEFPVVFVAGMGKQFNNSDSRNALALHPDLGIGPEYIDYKLRTKIPTLMKKVIQKQVSNENLGEEIRILYVALTRAKEKLILTGFVKKMQESLDKWSNTSLSFATLSSARTYFDWVAPALSRHSKWNLTERSPVVPTTDPEKEPSIDVKVITLKATVEKEVFQRIEKEQSKERLLSWKDTEICDEEMHQVIMEKASYDYPYQADQNLPVKLSVSDLKKQSRIEEFEIADSIQSKSISKETTKTIPKFLDKQSEVKVTGASRGTLYHKVMECLNLQVVNQKEDISKELDRMVVEGRITGEEILLLNQDKLYQFTTSDLAVRMRKAAMSNKLYKEQPFVIAFPANTIYPGTSSEEQILVQGIMDAYFEEEGELVLLDYKTDFVQEGEEEVLITRYRTQLEYYKDALERVTHKKVKNTYLYSFALNQTILL